MPLADDNEGHSGGLDYIPQQNAGGAVTDVTRDARHATDVVRAVCNILPGDITAALVAVLIADDANVSAVEIGRLLHKDPATVRRARKRLVDVDLLQAHTFVTDVSARASASETDVSARVGPRVHAGDPLSVSSSLFPTGTSADAECRDQTHNATKLIFASKRTAQKFTAVLTIVRRLVDAGWPIDDVVAAGIAVPTISIGTCEFWLNTRKQQQAANGTIERNKEQRRADDEWRRTGKTGVVKL